MSNILCAFVKCFTSTVTEADFTLDVDGNGEATPLTDGLLMLRHPFGCTGDAIVKGAVSEYGTRLFRRTVRGCHLQTYQTIYPKIQACDPPKNNRGFE